MERIAMKSFAVTGMQTWLPFEAVSVAAASVSEVVLAVCEDAGVEAVVGGVAEGVVSPEESEVSLPQPKAKTESSAAAKRVGKMLATL